MDATSKEGILSKRLTSSILQRWQKRYFCIQGPKVKYYKDEQKQRLLGAIDLRFVTLEYQDGSVSFSLVGDNDGQIDEIRASSEAEAREWAQELGSHIKVAKEQLEQVEIFLEGADGTSEVEDEVGTDVAFTSSGWLHKRGAAYNKQGVRKYREGMKYKRRYFSLDGSSNHENLDYFKDENKSKRVGFIDLTQVYHLEQHPPSSDGNLFPFDLVTAERIWSLAAESEQEQQKWFGLFGRYCCQLEAERKNSTILRTIQRRASDTEQKAPAQRLQNFGKSVARAEFYDTLAAKQASGRATLAAEGGKAAIGMITEEGKAPSVANMNRQRSASRADKGHRRQEQTLYEASTSQHRGSYGPGPSTSSGEKGAGKLDGEQGKQQWVPAWQAVSEEKSDATREIMRRALTNNILTATLDAADTEKVIDAMWPRHLQDREVLGVGEGASESGAATVNFFFVIESGSLLIKSASGEEDLGVEDSFGHSTLIGTHAHESNHYSGLHSIAALESTTLWCIDRATFRKTVAAASANRLTDWVGALRSVPLFKSCGLSEAQLNALAEGVRRRTYLPNEMIIRKGDAKAELFFIIESGRVSCQNITRRITDAGLSSSSSSSSSSPAAAAGVEGEVGVTQQDQQSHFSLELAQGDCFGERALLHEAERACDVVALTEVTCLALSRSTFDGLLGPMKEVLEVNVHVQTVRALEAWRRLHVQNEEDGPFESANPPAGPGQDEVGTAVGTKGAAGEGEAGGEGGSDKDARELVQAMTYRTYEEGEMIIRRGAVHDHLLLMSEGRINVGSYGVGEGGAGESVDWKTVSASGECFGESVLSPTGNDAGGGSALYQSDVVCFNKVSCLVISRHEWLALPLSQRLLGSRHPQAAGRSGSLQVVADVAAVAVAGVSVVVGAGVDVAGAVSKALAETAVDIAEAATVGAKAKEGSGGAVAENRSHGAALGSSTKDNGLGSLDDLEQLHIIGIGSFGTVRLAKAARKGGCGGGGDGDGDDVPCERWYALKRLAKAFVCQTHQQRNLLNEKNILKKANHPMIIDLAATYQDTDCLYMLLELVQGGELFRRLHGDGTEELALPEGHARFYTANLVLVFEYIHGPEMRVIYRDLKPENLLITVNGFIKVCDWGFAKVVSEHERTYTLCGSPEYLAPETINGVGHGKGVDYWALGALIYEMLVGTTPFVGDDFGNTAAISESILAHDLQFPDGFPAVAEKLVTSLLEPNPSERLGGLRNGAQDVRDHAWFTANGGAEGAAAEAGMQETIDWGGILQHRVSAPWLPEVSEDVTDTSNFDDFDEDDPDVVPLIEPYDGDDPSFASF
jgi:CRP-like cAMP-binding protein